MKSKENIQSSILCGLVEGIFQKWDRVTAGFDYCQNI